MVFLVVRISSAVPQQPCSASSAFSSELRLLAGANICMYLASAQQFSSAFPVLRHRTAIENKTCVSGHFVMPSHRRAARRAANGGVYDRMWPGSEPDSQITAEEYYRLNRNHMGTGGGYEALRIFFDGHSKSRKSRFPKWGRTRLIGFALVLAFRHAKVGRPWTRDVTSIL